MARRPGGSASTAGARHLWGRLTRKRGTARDSRRRRWRGPGLLAVDRRAPPRASVVVSDLDCAVVSARRRGGRTGTQTTSTRGPPHAPSSSRPTRGAAGIAPARSGDEQGRWCVFGGFPPRSTPMKVFVAGATGAVGRQLLPQLVSAGPGAAALDAQLAFHPSTIPARTHLHHPNPWRSHEAPRARHHRPGSARRPGRRARQDGGQEPRPDRAVGRAVQDPRQAGQGGPGSPRRSPATRKYTVFAPTDAAFKKAPRRP